MLRRDASEQWHTTPPKSQITVEHREWESTGRNDNGNAKRKGEDQDQVDKCSAQEAMAKVWDAPVITVQSQGPDFLCVSSFTNRRGKYHHEIRPATSKA